LPSGAVTGVVLIRPPVAATIASTVGASTLGSPIIIGLSGFNTAYVIQGAILVALAAIVTDRLFERLLRYITRHEG